MKKIVVILIGIVLAGCERPAVRAPRIITAASAELADVNSAVNQAVDGDTVIVPAGTGTWTNTFSTNKAITLQGGGAICPQGSGGTTPVGTDVTTIIDRHPNNEHKLVGFQVPAGKTARLTGFRFLSDASTKNTQAGMIQIGGGANCIRIDHLHLHYTASTSGAPTSIAVYGGVTGVIDHNWLDNQLGNGPVGIYLQNGVMPGDAEYAAPDDFGTDKFIFMEDNKWDNGYLGDANTGGQRFVYRYNTGTMNFDDNQHISAGYVANHGITGGRGRSTRAFEYYKNKMSAKGPIGLNKSPFPINGGTAMILWNIITQYRYGTQIDYTRKDNGTYPYGTWPNGWGNCNGTSGSVVDGPGGYPCLDQPGFGQGDLISGNFPNIINTRTGNAAQVIQKRSPIYVAGNTLNPAGGFSPVAIVGVSAPAIVKANREFYQQFGPYGESGTFDGTRGVGEGPVANRSTTCKTGVGWLDSGTQTLYFCGPDNVWSGDRQPYRPFTYPHPLTGGGGGASPTPVPTQAPTATILPTATPPPPNVSPTPTPSPTPVPTPTPSPIPSPTRTPTAAPTTTGAPSPTPMVSGTPSPAVSPTPAPTQTVIPVPSETPAVLILQPGQSLIITVPNPTP